MYLRHRCFDGWVTKTIVKPRIGATAGRWYVYLGFSRRKIPCCSAYTISEKAIRFWHPDYKPDRAEKLISSSVSGPVICQHATLTFHPNPCTRFWVILLDRHTYRQTLAKTCTSSFISGLTEKSKGQLFEIPIAKNFSWAADTVL